MQEPSTFTQIQPQFPEHEQLKCPRCDSTNTKFCYYNNYNLSQPRHFCKNCRRYWTKGGALRNIPVGGGTRKNSKRSSNPKPKTTPSSSSSSVPKIEQPSVFNAGVDQDRRMLDVGGSFSSLLNGQFGNFLEGLDPHGSLGQLGGEFGGDPNLNSNSEPGHHEMRNPQVELQSGGNNPESYLGDSSNWGGGGSNGWPDLSIYTPVLNPKTWHDGWNPGALLSAQQALLSTSRSFKCILDGPDLRDAEECLPFKFGPFKTYLDGRVVLGRVYRAKRSVGSLSSNGW